MKKTVKLVSVLLLVAMISMTLTTMVSAKGGIDAANTAEDHVDIMKKAYELGKNL